MQELITPTNRKITIDTARYIARHKGWFTEKEVTRFAIRQYNEANPESIGREVRKLAERGFFVRLGSGVFRFRNPSLAGGMEKQETFWDGFGDNGDN